MQIDQSTIGKNSLFVFFSQIIRLTTNFLIFVLIARFYGPESLGQFSLAFTIANICLVFADFGFDVLLATEIAKDRTDPSEVIKKYFSLKVIFMGIGLIIMLLIPSFQSFSKTSSLLIYILSLYVVFTSFSNFVYSIFRGLEKFEHETTISFITNSSLLISILLFGFLKAQLFLLVLLFVIVRILNAMLCFHMARLLVGTNIIKIDFREWRSAINYVLVFGFHFLFGNLFFKLDTILLGVWKGDLAVGIYQSAFKVILLVLLIPDILRSSVLPVASRLYESKKETWEVIHKLITKVLLLVAIPISFTLFFFSKHLISLIYGQGDYGEASYLLQIFSLVVLIRFYVEPYGLMITTSQKQILRMIIVIIATIISLLLNYYLIPQYGIKGAAYASLVVNALVGIGYIWVNSKYFLSWIFEIRLVAVLACAIIIIFFLRSYADNFFVLILSLISFTIVGYYVGLSNNEKSTFYKLIFKNI